MPAPKRRRWFSLSLRTLLIGMTLISVLFWWFLHHRQLKIAEKERIEARYDALGFGDSLLGWELPDAPSDGSPDSWEWLRSLAVPEVRRVDLSTNDPNTEEFLSLVRRASIVRVNREQWMGDLPPCFSPRTRELHVWGDFLQSQDLTDLSAAPHLVSLHCEPPLSPAGVRAVLSHPTIHNVSLPATVVDPAALSERSRVRLQQLQLDF